MLNYDPVEDTPEYQAIKDELEPKIQDTLKKVESLKARRK
jgi:hypothetical protein